MGTAQDKGPTPDKKVTPSDGPSGFFKIQGKISFDPKMCKALNPSADCKGPLIWGIWKKPLTAPDPGAPLFLSGVPAAKHGTTYGADKVPIAPKMFLSAFVNDNHNVTPQNPWPDKGDPKRWRSVTRVKVSSRIVGKRETTRGATPSSRTTSS
jgi:hypothetical protein